VSWGEVVFVTATSLLMASLLLSTYHTALHECLYFLCQVIQAVDRKTVAGVLTSENCANHRLLAQHLECLWGFWISDFLRTRNLLAIIPNTSSTILRDLDNR
jgi:hypothetical protein